MMDAAAVVIKVPPPFSTLVVLLEFHTFLMGRPRPVLLVSMRYNRGDWAEKWEWFGLVGGSSSRRHGG